MELTKELRLCCSEPSIYGLRFTLNTVWGRKKMKNILLPKFLYVRRYKNVTHGSNNYVKKSFEVTSLQITLILGGNSIFLAKNGKRKLNFGHFGQNLTSFPIGF